MGTMEQSEKAVENLLILYVTISMCITYLFIVALVIGIVAFVIINRRNKRAGKTVSRKKLLLRTLLPAVILLGLDLVLGIWLAFAFGKTGIYDPVDDDDKDRDWVLEEKP
ncbi:MAG: hypothetical protein GY854_09420 [Deltaproteobacteria bacterium]|nr:hypothetical protein [Deltaproteobacteria bacterium]